MSERTFTASSVAAAAILIGGTLVLVMPQHAGNIARLVVVTIAAAAGLHALGMNSPPAWWSSPFDPDFRMPWRRRERDEMEWIRAALSGWRHRLDDGSALPAEVIRLLRPLIEAAVERAHADDGEPSRGTRARLSPLAKAVLTADPAKRSRWQRVAPNRAEVAACVHRIMDEVDGLSTERARASSPNE